MNKERKCLEDVLFDGEYQKQVREAIRKAVNQADAAGLAPAYEPAHSKMQVFRSEQKKSREELIELRRQARTEQEERDRITLEFHRKVFELILEGGQPAVFIKRKALQMIDKWESEKINNIYAPIWKQLLDGSPTAARDFILSNDPSGSPHALRSASPFIHLPADPGDDWKEGIEFLKN